MKKISVILPCYNVSPYVARAIESLLNQIYTNIEIIAVDDGSTDETLTILNNIQKAHPRIKVFSQDNQGYGTAVNKGIKNATGDYIAILEPDDSVDNDYYGPLIAIAEGSCADVVFYNSYFECRQGFRKRLVSLYHPKKFTGSLLLTDDEISTRLALGNVGICFALYKRALLEENNILLDEQSRAYEDVPFIASVLNMTEKAAIVAGGGYYYNRDIPGQSVTNQLRFASILKVTENFFQERKLKPSRAAAIRGYFIKHLAVYWHKSNNNAELRTLISVLIAKIASKQTLICEEWTYQFLKKEFPSLSFSKKNFPPISFSVTPLKELPTLMKILTDGSYFQFLGFSRYKLARMLEENVSPNIILNEIYCLLNIPDIEKNGIIQDFFSSFLKKEEFTKIFSINNNITTKLMAKARAIGAIPDLSVYCENEQFAQSLREDIWIVNYPELENVSTVKNTYHFLKKSMWNLDEFLEYIHNKSIAIVGNSPCELNMGKGQKIDSNDIVIRFNNFEINHSIQNDYGHKTHVWGCTPTLESLKFREDSGSIDFILLPQANNYIPQYRMDYLENLNQAGSRIATFDVSSYMRQYDLRIFSLGLLMVLLLADYRNNVNSISIYGFSLTDQLNGVKHYFSGDPSAGKLLSFHKWSKEALILNTLIEQGLVNKC